MDELTLTIVLLVIAVVMLVGVFVMAAFMKKSKLKKLKEETSPKDQAYNQMQMLKSMINVLRAKGYDTQAGESMLAKAQQAYNTESYAECMEIVESAKRILARAREESTVLDKVSPQVEEEMKIIKKIDESSDSSELPTPLKELEKDLPENFLQSKFEIKVVEEKLVTQENGAVKEAAMLYLAKAKDAFTNKEYTDALRLAIRSNRILETGELPESKPSFSVPKPTEAPEPKDVVNIVEEEKKEEQELHCPNCGAVVRPEDKFCWNCGAKLVWTYRCPNCGAEVSTEDKFCRNCGYKLK